MEKIEIPTITISIDDYNDLLRAQKELLALEAGGVDNWEWYSDSLRNAGLFDEDEEDDG